MCNCYQKALGGTGVSAINADTKLEETIITFFQRDKQLEGAHPAEMSWLVNGTIV